MTRIGYWTATGAICIGVASATTGGVNRPAGRLADGRIVHVTTCGGIHHRWSDCYAGATARCGGENVAIIDRLPVVAPTGDGSADSARPAAATERRLRYACKEP